MQRTKFTLPDAINCSLTKNFTQVPNSLLRNPEISCKAKAILCLLLSNKEGWHSHMTTLRKMMREGPDALQSGLQELEKHGYLIRSKYRNKKTKIWVGSFWAYTDIPGQFNITEQLKTLENRGLEPQPGFPDLGFPDMDEPDLENPPLNNTNSKKTNFNKINSIRTNGQITPSQFEKFWTLYPKKAAKGAALSKWNTICNKPTKDRPTWVQIKKAVFNQKKSDQWQDAKYIPHATTWLNQNRWLDDPEEMKSYSRGEDKPDTFIEYGERWTKDKDGAYRNSEGIIFTE